MSVRPIPEQRLPETLSPATSIMELRPILCIQRDDGTVSPMIATDELPLSVRLQNVERVMSIEQAMRMGMRSVGIQPHPGLFYVTESIWRPVSASTRPPNAIGQNTEPAPRFLSPVTHTTQTRERPSRNPAPAPRILERPSNQPPTKQAGKRKSATPARAPDAPLSSEQAQAMIDRIIASTQKQDKAHDGKEYCSYWIRHGECDFSQQGCRYKHEMPDLPTLRSIGLRAVPLWWRERHGPRLGPANTSEPDAAGSTTWLEKLRAKADESSSESEAESEDGTGTVVSAKKEPAKKKKSKQKGSQQQAKRPISPQPLPKQSSQPPLRSQKPLQPPLTVDLIDLGAPMPPPSGRSIPEEDSIASPSQQQIYAPANASVQTAIHHSSARDASSYQANIHTSVPDEHEDGGFHVAPTRRHGQTILPQSDESYAVGIMSQGLPESQPRAHKHAHSGLLASKHAPSPRTVDDVQDVQDVRAETERLTNGCRPRVPAGSSHAKQWRESRYAYRVPSRRKNEHRREPTPFEKRV